MSRALLLVSALALGCAYTSHYTAPLDGRARAVWTGSGVAVELAGAPLLDVCAQQLGALANEGRIHLLTGELKPAPLDGGRPFVVAPLVWVPIYYGPPLVAVGGLPPPILRPPLFSPALAVGSALVSASNARSPGAPANSNDLAKLGAIVAVIAILVMPVIDLTIAVVPAENTTRSAEAIDQVNLYNDLARSPGSPCAYYGVQ
jgi:hypothetical protein